MEKGNNEAVLKWINKAEGDYLTAVDLYKKRRKKQLYIIAFHCQQVKELL